MTSKALRLSGLAKELDALAAASSSTLVVYEYTATANQTVFSGVDNNGLTLNYIGPNSLIFYNEGQLQKTVDFTTTSSSVLTLQLGAEAGALIRVYAFGTFAIANVYTKPESDVLLAAKANAVVNQAFHAVGTAASIAVTSGVATKVPLPLEIFDTNNVFDSTTNYRFQPTVPGYYQINGVVRFNSTGTAMLAYATLYGNNATLGVSASDIIRGTEIGIPSTVSTIIQSVVSTLLYMNGSTDYVELWGYVSGSSPSFANATVPARCSLQGYLAKAA